MDNLKIVGAPLPNMPWEDRPEGSKEVLWRYSKNPVIPRDILPTSNSVFNSAVVPFKGGYAGVFRCDDTNRRMRLHVGLAQMPFIGVSPRQNSSLSATTRRSASLFTPTTPVYVLSRIVIM